MSLLEKLKIPKIYWDFFEEHLEEQVELLKLNLTKEFTPTTNNIFNFLTPNAPKVVIVGQDPYPQKGLATGIAFGVEGDYIPPTLREIVRQASKYIDVTNFDYTLNEWKSKDIMLTNASLTTYIGSNLSHYHLWKDFMQLFLVYLNQVYQPEFVLLGKIAQNYKKYLNNVHLDAHPMSNLYGGKELFTGEFVKTVLLNKNILNTTYAAV